MQRPAAAYWIDQLHLTPHVEGGAFREVYRSALTISRRALPLFFQGDRAAATSIYFLLEKGQFSAFHRISADECWHFYYGDSLLVYEIEHSGNLHIHRLGQRIDQGETFQAVIRGGSWFAAVPAPGSEYALVGCTVAPGFDFEDFELAERATLSGMYPEHREIIAQLTRNK